MFRLIGRLSVNVLLVTVMLAGTLLFVLRLIHPPLQENRLVRSQLGTVAEVLVGDSYEIFLIDGHQQHPRQLTFHTANDRFPVLSPLGDQVAFVSWRDGNSEIYVRDLAAATLFNMSQHAAQDALPLWSPDGHWLVYSSRRDHVYQLMLADVGRQLVVKLTQGPQPHGEAVWLGEQLVFTAHVPGQSRRYHFNPLANPLLTSLSETEWQTLVNTRKIIVGDHGLSG